MVAAGRSNRQIAGGLFVSVRTVEGPIFRACMKLDVDDRNVLVESMGTTVRCRRARTPGTTTCRLGNRNRPVAESAMCVMPRVRTLGADPGCVPVSAVVPSRPAWVG